MNPEPWLLIPSTFRFYCHPSSALLIEPNPRVQVSLEDIDEKVEDDEQGGVEEDGAHDHGVIAVEGGVDEEAAESGDMKDCLHHEGSADDPGSGRSEKIHHREDAVPEPVNESHPPFRQSFGACGTYVFLIAHLEHAPAGKAGNVSSIENPKSKGGKKPVPRQKPPGDVKPIKFRANIRTRIGPRTKVGRQIPTMAPPIVR